jgi:hypothetical protein
MKKVNKNREIEVNVRFRNLPQLIIFHEGFNINGFPGIEYYNSHLPEIHENVIREVRENFTESYRELIQRAIDLLQKSSKFDLIRGDCLNTSDLLKAELSKHPVIKKGPIIIDQENSDRLKSLEMVIDGITQKSLINKKGKIYQYIGEWHKFLNGYATTIPTTEHTFDGVKKNRKRIFIDPFNIKVFEEMSQRRIDDLFSQLISPRRAKIKDKIEAWELHKNSNP